MRKLFFILLINAAAQSGKAQNCEVVATVSKNIIAVGDTFTMHVEALVVRGCEVQWPLAQQIIKEPFVLISSGEMQKTADNYTFIYTQDFKVSCYDSGLHKLNPVSVTTNCDSNNFYKMDSLPVMVNNVKVDMNAAIQEENEEVENGLTPAQKKVIWIIAVLLFLIACVYFINKFLKKKSRNKNSIEIDAFTKAMEELKVLKLQDETELGFKRYYSFLTLCLKNYLQSQLQIAILDKTSEQTKPLLHQNKFTNTFTQQIINILGRADFAKFAKLPPTADFAMADSQTVRNIITQLQTMHLAEVQAKKEIEKAKEIALKKKL